MTKLLVADEPPPVEIVRADQASPFVLLCDHAGSRIPLALGTLELGTEHLKRHIAWDIGALGVAQAMSARLSAPLVWQNYSRLVIDCNRPEHHPTLFVTRSEATDIPGNACLDETARELRLDSIYRPYHAAISRLLDCQIETGQQPIVVSVHSFTPSYLGESRPWQLGILYGDDDHFSKLVLTAATSQTDWCIGDNQPYQVDDKDHTVPVHASQRGLLNVLFEIRQDLITTESQQSAWAQRIVDLILSAYATLERP